MKYIFSSAFADRINDFVEQKNAVGFPYVVSLRILRRFDGFCTEYYPQETALTKELCMAWAVRKETENNNTFRNRLMPIREFAKYLKRGEEDAYVLPPDFAKKGARHIPHIYSEAEISSLWEAFDNLKPNKGYPIRQFVISTFIRLLYCCGLRPSEARKLRASDVDLEKGRLNIMESKGHKSRIIIMADDVAEMCRRYEEIVSKTMPDRVPFFPNSKGNFYNQDWFKNIFRDAKITAGVSVSGIRMRLYDFRHTFATHRLYQWMREGKDINAMMPYLSAYMGHEQLSDTYYYIHLVPGLFEQMSNFDYSSLENLLPEVESDE